MFCANPTFPTDQTPIRRQCLTTDPFVQMDNDPQWPFTGDPPSSQPTLPTTSPTIQGTHHTTTPSSEPLGPTTIPAAAQQGPSTASLPAVRTHEHSGARNHYAQDDHFRTTRRFHRIRTNSSSGDSFSTTFRYHSTGTISNCGVHSAPQVLYLNPRNVSNHNDHYSPSLRYHDAQTNYGQGNHFQPNNLAPQSTDPFQFGCPVRHQHQIQPQYPVSNPISSSHIRSPEQHSSIAEPNTITVPLTTPAQVFRSHEPRNEYNSGNQFSTTFRSHGARTDYSHNNHPIRVSRSTATEQLRPRQPFQCHQSSLSDNGTFATTATIFSTTIAYHGTRTSCASGHELGTSTTFVPSL